MRMMTMIATIMTMLIVITMMMSLMTVIDNDGYDNNYNDVESLLTLTTMRRRRSITDLDIAVIENLGFFVKRLKFLIR